MNRSWATATIWRRVEAARARARSSEDVLRTAKARLEAGSGMLLEAVFAAREVVMAAADLRESEVEAARARVRAARAAGWPGPEVVR
jgi:outer membrane protein TolC